MGEGIFKSRVDFLPNHMVDQRKHKTEATTFSWAAQGHLEIPQLSPHRLCLSYCAVILMHVEGGDQSLN